MTDNYLERRMNFMKALAPKIEKLFPGVKTEIKVGESCAYDKIILSGDNVNPNGEFYNFPLPEGLDEMIRAEADKNGFEIAHFCGIDNSDAQKAWRKANPAPLPPLMPLVDKRTKKGKAKIADFNIAHKQYEKEAAEYIEFRRANIPTSYIKNKAELCFDPKGRADDIMNFYSGTRYWGD